MYQCKLVNDGLDEQRRISNNFDDSYKIVRLHNFYKVRGVQLFTPKKRNHLLISDDNHKIVEQL